MINPYPQSAPELQCRGGSVEQGAAAIKSATLDDQARSPAAEQLRRRSEMRATIIMGRAYKGLAEFRQLRSASTIHGGVFS